MAIVQLMFAGMSGAQWGMLLGLGAIVLLVMWSSLRRMSQAGRMPNPTAAGHKGLVERGESTRRDLATLIAELDELSQQVHARLDAKLARLEALIREADVRIAELQRSESNAQHVERIQIELPAVAPTDSEESPIVPPGVDERHAMIYRLADSGLNSSQIAQETGRPVGEIELILSLRKARRTAEELVTLPRAT